MKAVIIGHICIDHNISESSSYTAAGGPGMFINKILRQIGEWEVTVAAPYGKDLLPHVKQVALYPPEPTSDHNLVYENTIKENSRTQKVLNHNDAGPVEIKDLLIEQADIIFIAPLLPNFPPDYVRQASESKALKILIPQGYFRKIDPDGRVMVREFLEADEIMPLMDIVIVSDQDHPQIKELALKWAQNNVAVVITQAKKGALIITKDKQISVPTVPVQPDKIIDSIGSGDIFSAGFAHSYSQTKDLETAVKFANKLARQCLFCTSDKI